VTRYLLDTNIISNVVKPQPSESLLAWMSTQRDEDLFITSLTVAEIRRGFLEKPRARSGMLSTSGSPALMAPKHCLQAAFYRSTTKRAWSGRS
jgi:predicted nucleic acid-binding protein